MPFDLYVGVDYSGAETPTSRLAGLQVYAGVADREPVVVTTPAAPADRFWNWTRGEIAEWLIDLGRSGRRFLAGLDHAFGFPEPYFELNGLRTWDAFLDDFQAKWPTAEPHKYVDFVLTDGVRPGGSPDDLRLTERWTSSAKSVFRFSGQGNVAHSTHAGLPWLRLVRRELGTGLHVWPFDGWDVPDDRSVLVEVYPSILNKRYPRPFGRTVHQHDAYAVARWLSEIEHNGALARYTHPPLSNAQRRVAGREGWILGVG